MTELILKTSDLKQLAKAKPVGPDLNIQYWSPSEVGEAKLVMLGGYALRNYQHPSNPGEFHEVPVAVFVDAEETVWENGSAILVSLLKEHLKQGDFCRIEYAGKKKSQKGFNCDNWKLTRMEVGK